MYGRYGPDELYKFLFELYIVLIIINLFIRSNILNFISLLVIIYIHSSTKLLIINLKAKRNNVKQALALHTFNKKKL